MAKKKSSHPSTGIMLVSSYFMLLAINIFVVYLASKFFPTKVVLGTYYISEYWALLHSMGTLTLINTFAIPMAHQYQAAVGKKLTSKEWMIAYLVVNFIGLWVIGRFSTQLGLGFSSWVVVLVLAIVLKAFQSFAMTSLKKNHHK